MRLLSLSVATVVLVLLACGVGVANIVASREQIHAESARELTMVSRVVASHLGQVLDNARLALLSVRDDPGLQSDQPLHPSAELDRLLQTVQGRQPSRPSYFPTRTATSLPPHPATRHSGVSGRRPGLLPLPPATA